MISPKLGFFIVGSLVLVYGAFSAQGKRVQPKPPAQAKKIREKIDFNRDIRPILANKCLNCHGNDKSAVRAGLHLDNRVGAIAKLPAGNYAIVPRKPEKSMLIDRINSDIPQLQMPPPDSHKVLSKEEKQLLRQWIEEGAEYKEHWAFVKPIRHPLPKVKNTAWPKNEIDYFVLAELEKKGIKPSPQADRATMLRRVSLDLTGLPPTPQEVSDFLSDASPNAYEKVVDRLLASPRYGERMAMDWMDYARYADSNGYQADFERYQWRWRDWVIDAYNQNMPFDRFTVEQIAGDMLPNATLEQKIATGFNRNHRINTEGGVIPEEWRVETVIDRVETTSTVWLGLTTGCARCHDHKYDPISQKEFFQLYAYFNNVPESGTGEERPINHPPFIKAPTPDQEKRFTELQAFVQSLKSQVDGITTANQPKADAWKIEAKTPPASLSAGLVGRYAFTNVPKAVSGNLPEPKINGKPKFEPGRATGSVETTDANFLELGDVGDFSSKQPFSYAAWVNPVNGNGSPFARMDVQNGYRGWDFFIAGGRPAIHLIDSWPGNALKVTSKTMIPNNQWSHVAVTYDGSGKPEGVKIYVNGQVTPQEAEVNQLNGEIRTKVPLTVGRRTGGDVYRGKVDDLVLYAKVLSSDEVQSLSGVNPAQVILDIPKEKRTKEQNETLARLWSREFDPNFVNLDKDLQAKSGELRTLDSSIPTVMVMDEMKKPRDAYLLVRGQYDKLGPKVYAGLPKVFPKLPKNAPNNRLGLAEWIVSPENPLTSRVTVNRYWERFFGEGIAPTIEDFGTRAEFPTHPELLDWLATEYIRLDWDTKAMLKKIAMSATYRQSSVMTPQLKAIDPTNKLLARGARFRLPGEVIRDQAIFAAGLLTEKIGGPSVKPYQPEGIWDETSFYGNLHNYKQDSDGNQYRRSLYTIWKRTAAPPNMTLFDASSRETCRVRRVRTDTPLQALTLMNDDTYLEAARVLAQRMIKEGGPSMESRIDYAYRLLLSRKPSQKEALILSQGLLKRISFYKKNPDAAKSLVAIGTAPLGKDQDPVELASYMIAASTLLNLDECVTKE